MVPNSLLRTSSRIRILDGRSCFLDVYLSPSSGGIPNCSYTAPDTDFNHFQNGLAHLIFLQLLGECMTYGSLLFYVQD